jgi:hypothetical protein
MTASSPDLNAKIAARSIRAAAQEMGVGESTLRKRMGRVGKGGVARFPVPVLLADTPKPLEQRLTAIERSLAHALVLLARLEGPIDRIAQQLGLTEPEDDDL